MTPKEIAQKYYKDYTNKYYSNNTINKDIKSLSATQKFDDPIEDIADKRAKGEL